MATALYRRYRSARFADLIGQEVIATTLRNEVRDGSLAHAYLFAGIRGTGKTSTARILARAVNCLEPDAGEPCNACSACAEIHSGAAVDVLEIDAASNRGIDEMRDLREKVKYLPASLRRKVYIIDEAHMLTSEAWNAFLKTLEEPPPHVLFVLATTEPHKVPETVRSRVQRFDFRRVRGQDLAAHLGAVAGKESVEVEPAALDLLARAAQGSVRDALSMLDQALAGGARPLTLAQARRALGLADPRALGELITGLAGGDAATALRAAAEAFDAGADPRQLLRELGVISRAAAMTAIGYAEGADVGQSETELIQSLARLAPAAFWVDVLELLGTAEINLRQPVDARMQVEYCLLRLAARRQSAAPEPAPAVAAPTPAPATAARATAPAAQAATPPKAPVAPADTAPPSEPPTAVAPAAAPSSGPVESVVAWERAWPVLVEAVRRRDTPLSGLLRDCMPLRASSDRLVIGAKYTFHLERIRDPAKVRILADAVAEVAGGRREVECVFGGDEPAEPAPPGASPGAPGEMTQAVLDTFAGSRVTSTRLRDVSREGSKPQSGA